MLGPRALGIDNPTHEEGSRVISRNIVYVKKGLFQAIYNV
jgi:hypothetical protein